SVVSSQLLLQRHIFLPVVMLPPSFWNFLFFDSVSGTDSDSVNWSVVSLRISETVVTALVNLKEPGINLNHSTMEKWVPGSCWHHLAPSLPLLSDLQHGPRCLVDNQPWTCGRDRCCVQRSHPGVTHSRGTRVGRKCIKRLKVFFFEENLQSLLKQKDLITQQEDLAVKQQHPFTVSQMRLLQFPAVSTNDEIALFSTESYSMVYTDNVFLVYLSTYPWIPWLTAVYTAREMALSAKCFPSRARTRVPSSEAMRKGQDDEGHTVWLELLIDFLSSCTPDTLPHPGTSDTLPARFQGPLTGGDPFQCSLVPSSPGLDSVLTPATALPAYRPPQFLSPALVSSQTQPKADISPGPCKVDATLPSMSVTRSLSQSSKTAAAPAYLMPTLGENWRAAIVLNGDSDHKAPAIPSLLGVPGKHSAGEHQTLMSTPLNCSPLSTAGEHQALMSTPLNCSPLSTAGEHQTLMSTPLNCFPLSTAGEHQALMSTPLNCSPLAQEP
ncbi:hypothetical protein STEG23_025459, partial [Scotinomys teguina]